MSDDLSLLNELLTKNPVTPARVGLGTSGVSLTTGALLELRRAEAEARDAVTERLATSSLMNDLATAGFSARVVRSAARDRAEYLRRPDLGRRLAESEHSLLAPATCDLAIVVADGLSSLAANRHALPLLLAMLPRLSGVRLGPVCVVEQGRVAIGDEIGERLGATIVLVLIGERPGLSAADSLGAYITHAPRMGRTDAERNCVSNIRPEGLDYQKAGEQIVSCIMQASKLRLTGVELEKSRELPVGFEFSSLFGPM